MATEIDRLVVVFDANFQKMEDKLNKVIAKNEAAKKKVEGAWAGKGLAAGAASGLDDLARSAGGVASALPGVGSALGALGPAGLTAAAGVGAFMLVMKEAESAINYTAAIKETAVAIGVSTDFLQKFNYAAEQSDISVSTADDALKNLNSTLGAITLNLPKSEKNARIFADALNISKDQLKSYHDVSELLPVIADRIKLAGTYAEQYAIAKKFGLESLLPLLQQGSEGFNQLAQDAKDLGIVLDDAVINKGAKAEDALRKLDAVMKAQKATTFIEYADTLILVKTKLNEATAAALGLLAALTKTVPLSKQIADEQKHLQDLLANPKRDEFEYGDRETQIANSRLKIMRLNRQAQLEAYHTGQEAGDYDGPKPTGGGNALEGKGGGEKEKGTKSNPVVTTTVIPQQTAYDPFTGDQLKTYEEQKLEAWKKANLPQEQKDIGIDWGDIKPLDTSLQEGMAKAAENLKQELHDSTYEGIRGGLEALYEGNFLDFLKQRLKKSLFDGLAESLTNIITGAVDRGKGDTSTTASILKIGAKIFGFAGGTNYAPGGLSLVGEHGPELVDLPRGSKVFPNLRGPGIPGAMGGGTTVVFDNRGAVIWEQAARQLMAYADHAASGAARTSYQAGRLATPQDMARSAGRRLG